MIFESFTFCEKMYGAQGFEDLKPLFTGSREECLDAANEAEVIHHRRFEEGVTDEGKACVMVERFPGVGFHEDGTQLCAHVDRRFAIVPSYLIKNRR